MPKDDNVVFGHIEAANGNINEVARQLNVSKHTVWNWLRKDATREEFYQDVKSGYNRALVNKAVSTLEYILDNGEKHADRNRAADTILRYSGKQEGYVPASYVEQDSNQDINVTVTRKGRDED